MRYIQLIMGFLETYELTDLNDGHHDRLLTYYDTDENEYDIYRRYYHQLWWDIHWKDYYKTPRD